MLTKHFLMVIIPSNFKVTIKPKGGRTNGISERLRMDGKIAG